MMQGAMMKLVHDINHILQAITENKSHKQGWVYEYSVRQQGLPDYGYT